ncbi:MAG: AAA family ATPase [Phenylobacterium sp.]|uniref:AAA family ATPase n=1 Tax=Phenylobacterium sp. TaxID=1871053 RepID=UPI0027368C64|nr:AAA family ATPase [Phenylobacterium sp.]MDP3746789.1 AAA family ATPase [Phenylobacterium sp.]
MNRIIILGCAGSGKTTLARQLARRIAAPVICLDEIWEHLGKDNLGRFREMLTEAHASEAWVSDGNFALATFDIRLPRADLVIWLDRPRLSCAWRATMRVFQPGQHHRPRDVAKVLRFIWGFDRINRPRIEAARAEHGLHAPVVRLRNDREIAALLRAARPTSA